jgi:hypothetical protein
LDSRHTTLVGRRAELDEIDRLLESDGSATALLLDSLPFAALGERSDLIADATRIKAVLGCHEHSNGPGSRAASPGEPGQSCRPLRPS